MKTCIETLQRAVGHSNEKLRTSPQSKCQRAGWTSSLL